MSKATYPLKLPLSVKQAAARLAKEDGVSLNQWIASAVTQKLGSVETAATFFAACSGHSSRDALDIWLDRVPYAPADSDDEPSNGVE